MDPDTAWRLMMTAMRQGDYDEAAAIASDLKNWLERGGFPPCVVPDLALVSRDPLSVPCKLQHQLALETCSFILFMA